MSSMVTRLALVVGLLLVVAAAVVTFAPASPSGATCGNWISPEWTDEKTQDIIDQASDTYDQAQSLGADDIADRSAGLAIGARRSHDLCADALSTRRTVSIVLAALGILAPVGLLFVVGGTGRRRPPASPATA